jgi:hypothetical protein
MAENAGDPIGDAEMLALVDEWVRLEEANVDAYHVWKATEFADGRVRKAAIEAWEASQSLVMRAQTRLFREQKKRIAARNATRAA